MMTRIKDNGLLDHVLFVIWTLLHLLYRCQREVLETLVDGARKLGRLLSFGDLEELRPDLICSFIKKCQSMQKIPAHIGVSMILPQSLSAASRFARLWLPSRGETADEAAARITLEDIARLVSWVWLTRIPFLSLHDPKGWLQSNSDELEARIHDQVSEYLRMYDNPDQPSRKIKLINNLSNDGDNPSGAHDVACRNTMYVYLYSEKDGKNGIIRAAKKIYQAQLLNKNATAINENHLNEKISQGMGCLAVNGGTPLKTEPDLLLVLGDIHSTLGYLPWQIRLTEIYWLPRLDRLTIGDLLKSLGKYSGCQQRFGT